MKKESLPKKESLSTRSPTSEEGTASKVANHVTSTTVAEEKSSPNSPKKVATRTDKTTKAKGSEAVVTEKKDKNESTEQVSDAKAGNDQSQTSSSRKKGTLDALLSEGDDKTGDVKIRKAKRSKNVTSGICHILATFNNTCVSFSDMKGNTLSWSSAGKCNFRGSRKSTSYAAQVVTQDAGRKAMAHGCKEVVVKVKGPGMGRDSAIRALQSLGFIITSIIEATPIPHNGCRPSKRRRV